MQEVHHVFRIAAASMFGCRKDGSNAIAVGWFGSGVFKDEAISAKSIYFSTTRKIIPSNKVLHTSHMNTQSLETQANRGVREPYAIRRKCYEFGLFE